MVATDDVRAELTQRFAEEEMLYREAQRWGLTENNEAIDLRLRQKMAFVSDEEHSDEELERQAEALGMDSDDAVIRNMLVHNMRLLLSTKGEREPTDAEIEAYYERERSRFARPARITGWHVFFSKDLRQSSVMAAARAAKAELDAEALEPEQAVGLGDVFPSGAHFKGQLARQLASRFGEGFATVAESLPEGQWSDPVETPFGAHLLLVQERTRPQAPPLAEIRATRRSCVRIEPKTKAPGRRNGGVANTLRSGGRIVGDYSSSSMMSSGAPGGPYRGPRSAGHGSALRVRTIGGTEASKAWRAGRPSSLHERNR